MMFAQQKSDTSEQRQLSSSLLRIVSLLLEGCALHAVEFDIEEHQAFRAAIRGIEQRFEEASNPQDLLILAGEANKTIQSYGQSLEKYLRMLTTEKHLAFELLAKSLIRICHTSEQSAQALRELEKSLKSASQIEDIRALRGRLSEVVGVLCAEAERQEQQYRELKERVSESAPEAGKLHDGVTGLPTLQHAEERIRELGASGRQGYVVAFFLKNIEVVNRRFGFAAGDAALRQFAAYIAKNLQTGDQLFRWRGPCFVVVAERLGSVDTVAAEAARIGARGPEQEVEGQGKSMLFRLTSGSKVFPIVRGQIGSELSARVDRFAAGQFKESPAAR